MARSTRKTCSITCRRACASPRILVASQNFDRENSTFELDLHGCSMEEGRTVAGQRIRECFRYGIETLRIIYGSADRLDGTLRQGVEDAIQNAGRFVGDFSHRDSYGMFRDPKQSTEVRVSLAPNPKPHAHDQAMVFASFTARYDASRSRHEPYYPLRSSRQVAGRKRVRGKH